MNPAILDQDIITLLDLDNLPEAEKAVLVNKMGEVILGRISARILDILNEEDRKKFDRILKNPASRERLGKKNSEEEVEKFLRDRIENLDAIRMEEILKFKEEIIEDSNKIKQEVMKE